MEKWIWFVLLTVVCWGAYVPAIHEGQNAIGGRSRALWAFLFVGVAYFLVAVLAPAGLLAARQDLGSLPSLKGWSIAIVAGVLGAAGAFGVILALMNGGTPKTVPPLVFAGAPIVATLVAMALHPPKSAPDWRFFLGIVMAAAGAALVLRFKPT
ncbi:MAG TPA: EamA family transporter [Phycisphaerae bacterium]|nr:EamA family transporter [Phycisphaerae bacterium]